MPLDQRIREGEARDIKPRARRPACRCRPSSSRGELSERISRVATERTAMARSSRRSMAAYGRLIMQIRMLCAVLGAFLATEATADDTSLDDIVVVATRAPTPLSQIGNSVTVIDQAAI